MREQQRECSITVAVVKTVFHLMNRGSGSGIHGILQSSAKVQSFKATESEHAVLLRPSPDRPSEFQITGRRSNYLNPSSLFLNNYSTTQIQCMLSQTMSRAHKKSWEDILYGYPLQICVLK